MAPFGKIYSYPNNFRTNRAEVVAALNGLEVSPADGFEFHKTNKTPEYLAKFPMGKVPALECADGFCLAEGGAICQYLAASGPRAEQLLGPRGDPKAQARIAEWVFFAESELVTNFLAPFLMCMLKDFPFDEGLYGFHLGALERACARVETALAKAEGSAKYLVGSEITLADVMVVGILIPLFRHFVDAEMREKIPNTVSYVQRLAETAEFKKGFKEDLVMCETRLKTKVGA